MKLVDGRSYADPEAAARKLLEIANFVEAMQDGRICIELINGPFLFARGGTPDEYSAGLKHAIEQGWVDLHESEAYVKFTQKGGELFARLRGTERAAAPADASVGLTGLETPA